MSKIISFSELSEAARATPPRLALVLGSGLNCLADALCGARSAVFNDVPGLAGTGVAGHRGCLTLGDWAGQPVLVFEGRLHYYEGHPWRTIMEPVHLARHLGAPVLLLTNAVGGIHEALVPGNLMAIRDHMEWTRPYAWRLPGPGGVGPARPSPYSPRLLRLLEQAALTADIPLRTGIYAQVTGPSYETAAEVRALRACGADAVGMSIAREIEAGNEIGMECAGLSCVTNRAAGLTAASLHHEEVLIVAKQIADKLSKLVAAFVRVV